MCDVAGVTDKHNQEVSLSPLQEAVTSAENWAISWRGRFGHAKTKMMTSSTNIQNGMLRIENEAIDVVPCTKHLGVVLSRNLDWHHHINELLFKAAPRAGLLRWMSKVLRPATTAQLYLYVQNWRMRLLSGMVIFLSEMPWP